MELETRSTGTMSILRSGDAGRMWWIPCPNVMITNPPAAAESVQPGKGSLYDE